MGGDVKESDIQLMKIALREARKGLGRTSPNPCVGAVIVKDGDIVARGYHKKAGDPHAEIEALRKAGERARGAVMYVTLEPCNHHGRTPPCSHAVAESGIKKVVIGMLDPNPLVDGSGAEFLSENGVEVEFGLLEEQCRKLNQPFLTYIKSGRPWVVLKAGLTLDGKITFRKNSGDAITGPESIKWVHRLRDRCDAILVGSNTVSVDDPSLTTRLKGRRGRDPIRVVLDTDLKISSNAKVIKYNDDRRTWIFCGPPAQSAKISELRKSGVEIFQVATGEKGRVNLEEVLTKLGSRQITSLLVEGGAEVHGSFLKAGLVDHIHLVYAPYVAGDEGTAVIKGIQTNGGRENAIRLNNISHRRLGDDLLISGDVIFHGHKE